jgi:hypothetical protein
VVTEPAKQDNDVDRLFSWLQTPDLRYREFAGAREVADAVVVSQGRPNKPQVEVPEETPTPKLETAADDHSHEPPAHEPPVREPPAREAVRGQAAPREPTMVAPMPMPPRAETGPFSLGAAGRGAPRQPAPPLPTPSSNPPSPPTPSQPSAAAQTAAGGLLGGAYRESGSEGRAAPQASGLQNSEEPRKQEARPLDAVFGRLGGGNVRPPDPRERLRHIPGLGASTNRSR